MLLRAICVPGKFPGRYATKRLLRMMKLTAFLLLVACLQVNASGYAQITLSEKNAPLKKVFKEIQKQSGYDFFYPYELVEEAGSVTVTLKNAPLQQAVETVLKGKDLSYEIFENTVVIKRKERVILKTDSSKTLSPIKGRILSSTGEPLAGASVKIKGTSIGTSTDSDGRFTIDANPGQVLVVSYVGYDDREVTLGNSADLSINLELSSVTLSEVVVGYGTKKREHLTGSVSTANEEVFKSRPVTNSLNALQGAVPGVVIQRYAGQPGKEVYDLNVRGASSTNGGNAPLVLIDGVVGNLDLLNPNDIESISVLKDAAASIYGARAAGGVFLVTTKRGRKGAAKITYNSNYAISKMTGMMKSPTHYEMAIMDNEANIHNGAVPLYTEEHLQKLRNNDPNPVPHPNGYGGWLLFFSSTDWVHELLENGFQHSHNLNLSGGGTNSNYFLSAGYLDTRGVVKYANDNNKRYNLRLNYDYDISKRIRLESKVFLENQQRTDIGGVGDWVIGEAIFGMPNHPVYTPDGKFFAQGGWGNAVSYAKEGTTATFNTRSLNTNFKLIADIIPGLKLNLQSGINYLTGTNTDYAKPIAQYKWDGTVQYYAVANPGHSRLSKDNLENISKNFTGYFEYRKTFGGVHDLNVMAGASHEENNRETFLARVENVVSDDVPSLGLGSENWFTDGSVEDWSLRSLFSRVSYAFDNKYLLEGILRYDGSSRFSKDKRWGFFPGISAGWRISQENFFRNVRLFDELKLRGSYGTTGNQEAAKLYDYVQFINIGGPGTWDFYPFGAGARMPTASLDGMVSPDRTWETVINKNIGVDATLLNNRLGFSFDYFIKRNKNMMIPVAYPSMLGSTPPTTNAGTLKTWGFETSVSWTDKIGELSYSARVIVSDAQNKLVNYGGQSTYVLGINSLKEWPYNIREGDPLDTYYAYEFDGVIRDQKELDDYKQLEGVPSDIGIGDARFKDINGDGKISLYGDNPGETGDVVNVGTTAPRFNYGINLSAKFKGFDFSVFLQGVGKRTLFRTGDYSMPWSEWWRQPPQFYYGQTWNEDRPDAKYPRLTHGNIRWWNYQASTLQQINAAYIRLKNLQVGYTFPSTWFRKLALSQARVYFSGQDIWEHHDVKGGWDPESANWGGNYPFQRMYSFGLDLTF